VWGRPLIADEDERPPAGRSREVWEIASAASRIQTTRDNAGEFVWGLDLSTTASRHDLNRVTT